MKKLFLIVVGILLVLGVLSSLNKNKTNPKTENNLSTTSESAGSNTVAKGGSRSFYLGFTQWPPSFEPKDIEAMYDFHKSYADLAVYHQVEGVAWNEALENKTYPKRLTDNWAYVKNHFPTNRPIYLALTPLNDSRTGLANYANQTGDQEALTEPWKNYALNNSEVKTAYVNYVKRAVNFFNPKFLAIDIESNVLLSKDQKKWQEFLELHEFVYKEIKKTYPQLTVFSTVQYEHLNATQSDAFGKEQLQKTEVEKLLNTSDLLALSTYPYSSKIKPVKEKYFDLALSFKKPIAIAETGYASEDFSIYGYKFEQTPEDQKQYFEILFKVAQANSFKFIVNFTAFDYLKLLQSLPQAAQELAGVWVYTGIKDSKGAEKPVFNLWQQQLQVKMK